MNPVDLSALAQDPEPIFVEIAKDQPEYRTLPALVYRDGKVLTEWTLTEEERRRPDSWRADSPLGLGLPDTMSSVWPDRAGETATRRNRGDT
jgi:hypothetical protein